MGLATHLGPWLLGTIKNTTGTVAGQMRNVGAAIVAQNKAVAYTDSAATVFGVIPAGALITGIQLIQTTTFTSGTTGTVTVLFNGVAAAAASITTGTAGVLPVVTTSAVQAALFNNVGTTDCVVTYTGATLTAGVGTLVISYMVRQADGTYVPTSFTA